MSDELTRFQRLLEQAQRELDGLSEQLAAVDAQLRQTEAQVADLEQYLQRLGQPDATQMDRGGDLLRQRGYLGQLFQALGQLNQQVSALVARRQETEQAWLAQRARVKALEKYLQRRLEAQQRRQERQAQHTLDERAAWQWHTARASRS